MTQPRTNCNIIIFYGKIFRKHSGIPEKNLQIISEGPFSKYPLKPTSLSTHVVFSWILWDLMPSTSFVFTELANTMKYEGGFLYNGFLYNLVFTEWRHCGSQNEVWARGGGVLYNLVFIEWRHCVSQNVLPSSKKIYIYIYQTYIMQTHILYKSISPCPISRTPFWGRSSQLTH